MCSISMRMVVSLGMKGIRNGSKAEGELHHADCFIFLNLGDYYKGAYFMTVH